MTDVILRTTEEKNLYEIKFIKILTFHKTSTEQTHREYTIYQKFCDTNVLQVYNSHY